MYIKPETAAGKNLSRGVPLSGGLRSPFSGAWVPKILCHMQALVPAAGHNNGDKAS